MWIYLQVDSVRFELNWQQAGVLRIAWCCVRNPLNTQAENRVLRIPKEVETGVDLKMNATEPKEEHREEHSDYNFAEIW